MHNEKVNASDEEAIKDVKVKLKLNRDTELNDLRFILSHAQGRRIFYRLLEHCRVFNSVWEASAKIHYNSGRQDVGHFIQAEIVEADQNAYFKMLTEAKGVKQ